MAIHESVVRSWTEVELAGQDHRTILVIETSLKVSPDDPAFDSSAFDDLVEAAVAQIRASSFFDRVRIVPKA